MATENILQHPILTNFAFPFFLIFFIVFAVLEKTKVLGESRSLNAWTAFVIGLIFIGAVFPKDVVNNLILFLIVAIIVVFVVLLIWGFATGGDLKESIIGNTAVKWILGIVIVTAVIVALIQFTGVEGTGVYDALFGQDWSSDFWTNFVFIILIAGALAVVLKGTKGS